MIEHHQEAGRTEYPRRVGGSGLPWLRGCVLTRNAAVLLFLFLASVLFRMPLHAEPVHEAPIPRELPGDLIFEQLGEGSGLVSQVISGFAEDGDGFIWISSQGGLQRWDGYHLTTYKSQLGVATSLPDNLTQVLHTDSAGNLWVGTSSGGLARYDRRHNWFIQFRTSTNGVAPVNIEAIEDDGHGGLWVGGGTGLDHLDTGAGIFTHTALVAKDGAPVDTGSVNALHRFADGSLLIGTSQGLLHSVSVNEKQRVVERFEAADSPAASVAVLCFAVNGGAVWIGTEHGVYLLDNSGPRQLMSRPPTDVGLPQSLFTSRIITIATDRNAGVWIGTQDQGVYVVTSFTSPVRHIAHDATQPTSLADDWIEGLFLSHQGIMWIGSRRGVSYIDTTPRGISTLLGGEGAGASLRDSDVYAVLQRHDGTIWVGLSKHGIDILSPAGKRVAEIQTVAGIGTGSTLPNGTAGFLRESINGGVYIVSQQGLYLAENADIPAADLRPGASAALLRSFHPQIRRLPIGDKAAQGLFQVLPDRDSKGHEFVWLGGANGLWTYDPAGSGPAVPAKINGALTDARIRVLFRGEGPLLWVGTVNGLNRLNIETGEIVNIYPDPANPQGFGGGLVSSLMTDRKGRLWAGTFTGGINVLQGIDAHGKARFHRIVDALPNDTVDCLLEAADGKIWASTDAGLAVVDPFSYEVQPISRAEGAVLHTYWDGVGAKTNNGDLLFGGSGGLTIVRPSRVAPWTYMPPLVVTSARIGTTEVPPARFNSGPEEYPIWIPSDQNNLTLEFAALDYTAPARNRYEYKLEGFDRDWISADPSRRVLRYTNLPPGRYTLLLRGSNRDGVWAQPRRIRILVLPAWYQKAWFRFLAFLAALASLIGIFFLATAYMRIQQRELERQVALRTAELEQKTEELKTSQQKLEHMAYTDSLTGLPNRRMFTEHFRRLLALKRRQQGTFAVLLMDFDDFKIINDTYGHDAGDAVLKEMATRMSAVVRESDCLARLGGDEYGLILGQSPDAEATEQVCHKIIESFVEPVMWQGAELRTSPSIGVAMYPFDGKTQDKLYKTADLALYDAKRGGGNRASWSQGATTLGSTDKASQPPLIAS